MAGRCGSGGGGGEAGGVGVEGGATLDGIGGTCSLEGYGGDDTPCNNNNSSSISDSDSGSPQERFFNDSHKHHDPVGEHVHIDETAQTHAQAQALKTVGVPASCPWDAPNPAPGENSNAMRDSSY